MSRETVERPVCPFCGRAEHEVEVLVVTLRGAAICEECIEQAMGIVLERRVSQRTEGRA